MSWFRAAAALRLNIASHRLSHASPLSRPDFFRNLVGQASNSPVNGHIKAKLDPLELEDRKIVDPVFYGLSKADLDREFFLGMIRRIAGFLSKNCLTQAMREILNKNEQWRHTFHSFTQPQVIHNHPSVGKAITLIPGNLNRRRALKKVFKQQSQPFSTEVTQHFDFGEEDLASEERLWCLFERWMSHYATPIDHDKNGKRFNAFKKNAIFVHEFNKKGKSFELGLNPFADLTNEEFNRIYNGRPHGNSRTMRGSSKRGICTIADGVHSCNEFQFYEGNIIQTKENVVKKHALTYEEMEAEREEEARELLEKIEERQGVHIVSPAPDHET